MPLLDHFRPPLRQQRHWESFHAAWLGSSADALNRQLPANYFAEEQTHAGMRVEIDVATFEETGGAPQGQGAATATLPPQTWAPPAPAVTWPTTFADDFEVLVFATDTGPRLVAAIELISPANKDRPEARRAFAAKCASYLYQSTSVIIIDIVTERQANLHAEVAALLQTTAPGTSAALYAVAYRPIRRQRDEVAVWPTALALDAPLPVLPLAIDAELCLPVDLEATYMDACRRRRLA